MCESCHHRVGSSTIVSCFEIQCSIPLAARNGKAGAWNRCRQSGKLPSRSPSQNPSEAGSARELASASVPNSDLLDSPSLPTPSPEHGAQLQSLLRAQSRSRSRHSSARTTIRGVAQRCEPPYDPCLTPGPRMSFRLERFPVLIPPPTPLTSTSRGPSVAPIRDPSIDRACQ